MEDDLPQRNPHQEEILEALIEAAVTGNADEYAIFSEEWDRSDPIEDEGWHIRFPQGTPIPYTAMGYCYHCREEWAVAGIAFGAMIPGLSLMIHVQAECPEAADCHCWIDGTEDHEMPFGLARCQRCDRAEPICECDQGVSFGPCVMFERHERENGFPGMEDVSPPE